MEAILSGSEIGNNPAGFSHGSGYRAQQWEYDLIVNGRKAIHVMGSETRYNGL